MGRHSFRWRSLVFNRLTALFLHFRNLWPDHPGDEAGGECRCHLSSLCFAIQGFPQGTTALAEWPTDQLTRWLRVGGAQGHPLPSPPRYVVRWNFGAIGRQQAGHTFGGSRRDMLTSTFRPPRRASGLLPSLY